MQHSNSLLPETKKFIIYTLGKIQYVSFIFHANILNPTRIVSSIAQTVVVLFKCTDFFQLYLKFLNRTHSRVKLFKREHPRFTARI